MIYNIAHSTIIMVMMSVNLNTAYTLTITSAYEVAPKGLIFPAWEIFSCYLLHTVVKQQVTFMYPNNFLCSKNI